MDWFRWHHGCVTDPKFPLIARRSGQNVAAVLAVWAALLERASQAEDRGGVAGFDCESFDVLLGLDDGACQAILDAFVAKGMIVDGAVAKWEERQPAREDATAAQRKREQRQRDKLERENKERSQEVALCHAESQNIARRHAKSQAVTPRLEKIRKEKKEEAYNNSLGGEHAFKRAREAESAGFDCPEDSPGLEFQELRNHYDQHGRPEAPLAGFLEYKQLRAARAWPGRDVIYHALERLERLDPGWRSYPPGLAKFLRERWWRMPPKAGASPQQRPVLNTFAQQQAQARQGLASFALAANQELQHGLKTSDSRENSRFGNDLPSQHEPGRVPAAVPGVS